MDAATPFKWRHFEAESILLCVRWYLRYALSYRDLVLYRQMLGVSPVVSRLRKIHFICQSTARARNTRRLPVDKLSTVVGVDPQDGKREELAGAIQGWSAQHLALYEAAEDIRSIQ